MFAVAALALLLAGDAPVAEEQIQTLPVGKSYAQLLPVPTVVRKQNPHPLRIEVGIGWVRSQQTDPFGRTGATAFTTPAPHLGARLRGQTWYLDFAGQLARTSLTNRNTTASIGRDIASIGPVRWGLTAEFADVGFRRDDFRSGDVTVGTSRNATIGLAGVSFGIGPYRGTSLRVTALGGYYKNRYGSIILLPNFEGDEPLSDDELPVYGGKVSVDGITLLNRVELGGSVRYLQLHGGHGPSVPDQELSGTATLNIRLFNIGRKQLYVGGLARFGPPRASIITDKTFGLRGIWKFR